MRQITTILIFLLSVTISAAQVTLPQLKVSANGRYFTTADGKPFFWLGDTGWLLFIKLNREQSVQYLEQRKQQGFNVIQVMVLHDVQKTVNVYGDSALINENVSQPNTTAGNNADNPLQYDFWDHVDFVIDEAAKRGIYMALVPVWGSNVKSGKVTQQRAGKYATFLAQRYKDRSNIIWLNGGDIKGSDSTAVWKEIGNTIYQLDKNHLITFHPRGRNTSSRWFHREPWLHFNMFQSGHRNYAQDTSKGDSHYGEDNWMYVLEDFAHTPIKPTLDGEPSYEDIPQGLHDSTQPYWNDNDVRRYAYWSVFAGGCGFTYGHNAVMQMHRPGDTDGNYGVKDYWYNAVQSPGAQQMIYLKNLLLSEPYFERVPDQSMVVNNGKRYERVVATRGKSYALFYTYTGKRFTVKLGKISGDRIRAYWYNPKDGTKQQESMLNNTGTKTFDPPGEEREGNDWVLVLEDEH